MCFKNIVFVATVCVIMNFPHVNSKDPELPEDKHTFVALLNIVYPNRCNRICTGTIIHELFVLTIAQCFVQEDLQTIPAELTFSFVVVGTKNMYASGYEQYLPIERVIFHPDFKGWTANVALVQTFESMVHNRPGVVLPRSSLVLNNSQTDTNLTVISWGKCDYLKSKTKTTATTHTKTKATTHTKTKATTHITGKKKSLRSGHELQGKKKRLRSGSKVTIMRKAATLIENVSDGVTLGGVEETSSGKSPDYRKGNKLQTRSNKSIVANYHFQIKNASGRLTKDDVKATSEKLLTETNVIDGRRSLQESVSVRRWLNSWSTGPDQQTEIHQDKYKLSVGEFGYVNSQTCRKLVESTVPAVYTTDYGNSIVCYTSEDHFITKEDAGAPALQQGRLVAITIAGLEIEGDHVAVGLYISHYWKWIEQNLP